MDDNDAQQLKKRARRRLVGAVVFASFVAIVLPMIMDHQPGQTVQDVEIRIPGQDEKPFAPRFAAAPVEKEAASDVGGRRAALPEAPKAVDLPQDSGRERSSAADKPAPKASDKVPEKSAEKPADKATVKPADADARRASAILAGQGAAPESVPPAKPAEFVILIGAFASEENVRNIRVKLQERGVRTYTEPLDTPGGKRTRVRAGPFPTRDAAEKGLEKMKQVGVSGVIASK